MYTTPETKICIKCGAEKPIDEFHKRNGIASRTTARCKLCNNADAARYREANRELINQRFRAKYNCPTSAVADWTLRRKYGIGLADYHEMLTTQTSGCAICGQPAPNGTRLHVDHDHTTGAVRGLLCYKHNTMLGLADDSITTLCQAAEYLRKTKGKPSAQ